MKKGALVVLMVSMLIGGVWGIEPADISIKAGPTEPGEKLALVWVEAFVYPRVV